MSSSFSSSFCLFFYFKLNLYFKFNLYFCFYFLLFRVRVRVCVFYVFLFLYSICMTVILNFNLCLNSFNNKKNLSFSNCLYASSFCLCFCLSTRSVIPFLSETPFIWLHMTETLELQILYTSHFSLSIHS